MCRNLFFDKVKLCRSETSLKYESLVQVFSCEFCKISKKTFFAEHHRATSSNYSSISSSEGRIGKRNCILWYKSWSICTNLSQKCKLSKKDSPGEILTCFRSSCSQIFFKIGVLNISQIPQENACVGDTLIKLQSWRL